MTTVEKINKLVAELKKLEDCDELLEYVFNMIDYCGQYVGAVVSQQSILYVKKSMLDGESFHTIAQEADTTRSIKHDALITTVKIVNRLCGEVGAEPIYTGDIEKRVEVAEFAKQVVNEMFDVRPL